MSQISNKLNPISIVAKQYTEWAYPKPVLDMALAINEGYYEYGTPSKFLPLLFPERRSLEGMKVLIAGCGTNQAAYNAITLPKSEITAIDLSISSLEHSQFLKEKHGLDNLNLLHMSLLDVGELGEKFDLIISTGVLHHLPNPLEGLNALREVLDLNGMINLMLYGSTLRTGVYMLQKAFQHLGFKQTPEDIQLVRSVLSSLPKDHAVHRYLTAADDLDHDSGIVDTFLHPIDHAFTVPQIMKLLSDAKLCFWDWIDGKDYSYLSNIHYHKLLSEKFNTVTRQQQFAAVEMLSQTRGTHRFLACHPERRPLRPEFTSDGWENFIPVLHPSLTVAAEGDISLDRPAKIKRDWHEIELNRLGIALLEGVDGNRSIRDILEQGKNRVPELVRENAQEFFSLMQEFSHLMYFRND